MINYDILKINFSYLITSQFYYFSQITQTYFLGYSTQKLLYQQLYPLSYKDKQIYKRKLLNLFPQQLDGEVICKILNQTSREIIVITFIYYKRCIQYLEQIQYQYSDQIKFDDIFILSFIFANKLNQDVETIDFTKDIKSRFYMFLLLFQNVDFYITKQQYDEAQEEINTLSTTSNSSISDLSLSD